ncbi:MAG: hypothetical protein AAFP19_24155 [Bacteroidota bacterium]
MKTINLLFLSLFSLAICLNAQSELTADYQYEIGDTVYVESHLEVDVSSGASGADLVWDFSNLELPAPSSNYWVYADPDKLTGLAAAARDIIAPQSNVAAKYHNLDDVNQYILFRYQDENVVEDYGNFFIDPPQIGKVSNPVVLYNFPMSLSDEISNSYTDSVFTEGANPGEWNLVSALEKENQVVFDGIGEIITDKGTYPNCLRFKRVRSNATAYSWVYDNISQLIVTLVEFNDPDRLPNITFSLIDPPPLTSVKEDQITAQPLIYLTQDRLVSITFEQGIYDYFLLDNAGRQLSRGNLHQTQPNTQYDLLRNINTPSGIYYIALINNKTGNFTTSSLLIP